MAKLKYISPQIELLTSSNAGKHNLIDIIQTSDWADLEFDVQALVKEFGSPLFILSEEVLRARYRNFRDTFTAPGIETIIAYSYKTNYLPAVCSILHEEGAWAEVVSGMEYTLARALGVPGENIVFNGPYKTREEIERAIYDNALINIDGFDELSLIEKIAKELSVAAKIGLRINYKNGFNAWTKFGFNSEKNEALEALKIVKKAGQDVLHLQALHNHGGTFQVQPKVYGHTVKILGKVAKQARSLGLSPQCIDIGGGYPSTNVLKPAFDTKDNYTLDGAYLKPYAEEIIGQFGKVKKQFADQPVLIMEPGRAIVDAAVRLASTVVSIKNIAGEGPAAILDAGVNILPTAYWYNHKIQSTGETSSIIGNKKTYALYGPLCMQIDKLRDKITLPEMNGGDVLIIDNVGAYCQTQSMQFIQPRPATILLGINGPELIRKKESWGDVFNLDLIPNRLRSDKCNF